MGRFYFTCFIEEDTESKRLSNSAHITKLVRSRVNSIPGLPDSIMPSHLTPMTCLVQSNVLTALLFNFAVFAIVYV